MDLVKWIKDMKRKLPSHKQLQKSSIKDEIANVLNSGVKYNSKVKSFNYDEISKPLIGTSFG